MTELPDGELDSPHGGPQPPIPPGARTPRGVSDEKPRIADTPDAEGIVIRSASEVSPGERLTIRFAEDQLTATVDHE